MYTNQDYNSNNGMQTSLFGPIWFTLHLISFNYPVNPTNQDKINYMNFIKSFKYTLPCVYCRNNLESNLKNINFNISSMKNRETFSKSIYNLHNHVNKMLGKKIKISYVEVRDRYEAFRSRCNENNLSKNIKTLPLNVDKKKKEKKCDNSLYGVKGRAVIEIIPKNSKKRTFINKCKKKSIKKKSSKKEKI
jgi:hypothetical protein